MGSFEGTRIVPASVAKESRPVIFLTRQKKIGQNFITRAADSSEGSPAIPTYGWCRLELRADANELLPMSIAGIVCLKLEFRGNLPRESAVIPKILVKGLNRGPKLTYFEPVAYS